MKNLYESKVKLAVKDSIDNWIKNGLPDEIDYRLWFGERRIFYTNRIQNIIIKKKPVTDIQIYQYVQEEVDKIKENDYARSRETSDS